MSHIILFCDVILLPYKGYLNSTIYPACQHYRLRYSNTLVLIVVALVCYLIVHN